MKYFEIDKSRDLLTPDIECYQLNVNTAVEQALKNGTLAPDFVEAPSWSKFVNDPLQNKGFFVSLLNGIYQGQIRSLNVQKFAKTNNRVVQMFFGQVRKNNFALIKKIAQQSLPNVKVILLTGDEKEYGNKVNNKTSEKVVKQAIEENGNVLILTSIIGQRSFSIKELDEVYLAYDKGQEGATVQKMSRALTPGAADKVGKIFSLSFDPNRDDKFDAMIIESALNMKLRKSSSNLLDDLKEVLYAVNIFNVDNEGKPHRFNTDLYLTQALARKSVSRVLGMMIDMSVMTDELARAIENGSVDYERVAKVETHGVGPTFAQKQIKKSNEKISKDEEKRKAELRKILVVFLEKIKWTFAMVENPKEEIDLILKKIIADKSLKSFFHDAYGFSAEAALELVESGIIKKDWITLQNWQMSA